MHPDREVRRTTAEAVNSDSTNPGKGWHEHPGLLGHHRNPAPLSD